MTLQLRHLGSRLLLILALAATLFAGIVAVQWVTSHGGLSYAFVTSIGNDSGGGHIRSVGSVGGDNGGGKHRDSGIVTSLVGGDSGGGGH